MCRLWRNDLPVDVMPCPDHGVGTDNRWFLPGSRASARVALPSGRDVAVLGPVYFAAAKIEAFRSRGRFQGELDWYGASDLEDLLALVDGCPELPDLVGAAEPGVRAHIAGWARELLSLSDVRDVIAGNVSTPGRTPLLTRRLEALEAGHTEDTPDVH